MSTRRIRLGISPCPNDTFTFHGLLTGAVRPRGFELQIELADVEELNTRFASGRLEASKVSFYAALELAAECIVLRAGSAIGFGVGPLLLARRNAPPLERARILCPGMHTTAYFLFRLFHPEVERVEQAVFSEILPALERGEADYGVCIHEARFTHARHGLVQVEDLGTTWEDATSSPLPLGGIVVRESLDSEIALELERSIQISLDHARAHPADALQTMRAHARELDDDAIRAHVDLYVNEWTRDLGSPGDQALLELWTRALEAALILPESSPLRIR